MDIFSITVEALGCLTGLFLFLFDTADFSLSLTVFPIVSTDLLPHLPVFSTTHFVPLCKESFIIWWTKL